MWAHNICDDAFSPQALSLTERLLLKDLGYCLLEISRPEVLEKRADEIRVVMAETARGAAEGRRVFLEARTQFPF